MNVLVGNPSVYSVGAADALLQVSTSPNGRFFAVLTASSLSLWNAEVQQTMIGITFRSKEFLDKSGKNHKFAWGKNSDWIAVLVCFLLIF